MSKSYEPDPTSPALERPRLAAERSGPSPERPRLAAERSGPSPERPRLAAERSGPSLERPRLAAERPLLLVDVDGVISLFGFDRDAPPSGQWQMVDGIAHFLSGSAGGHLRRLSEAFELAWCTGWEEKANEYLPRALGLEQRFPCLSFAGETPTVEGHWKLGAIDSYAGADRALAWIDDAHEERYQAWAQARAAPTLLISTDPAAGLTEAQVERLLEWASALDCDHRENRGQPGGDRRPGSPRVA
jgi:hypothetical protein